MANHQSLGGHYVCVAGTEDFLHAANTRRAVGHRGHGLGASDTVNLSRARGASGVKQSAIDAPIGATGGTDSDFTTSRHFCQCDGHQGSGHEWCSAPRDINSNALKGIELLTNAACM